MSMASIRNWALGPLTPRTEILVLRPDNRRIGNEGEDHNRLNTSPSTKKRQLDAGFTPQQLTQLVTNARDGDKEAFGQVVTSLQRPLYFAVMRITQHPQDARDIVQRAFLKAWEKLPNLEETEKFRSWLFTIGINLARNLRRDKKRRQYESLDDRPIASQQATVPQQMSRQEERNRLRAALIDLPTRQQEVVTLRIDAELSFQEIGESVGCTAATARVNFHHGMKRLRELLTNDDDT